MKRQLIFLALIAAAAPVAWSADGEGMVMRALDERLAVPIQMADTRIAEAVEHISAQTGVTIRLDDDVLDCLPHGGETRLRLTARDVRLRDALTAMLQPMSLQWRVKGMVVVISPSTALRRINRRPTFTEVGILAALDSQTIQPGVEWLTELRRITGVGELSVFWHVRDKAARAAAQTAAAKRLPCTGGEYLDWLCHGRKWTWYVWGTELVIMPHELQARRQMGRLISVRYQGRPLLAVVRDLARQADLKIVMAPGSLKGLDATVREDFSLVMNEATIAEAFDAIGAATGLTFAPDGLAIRVSAPADTTVSAARPARPRSRQRVPFLVTMPYTDKQGRDHTIVFRPDELPADMVADIAARKAEFIAACRAAYMDAEDTEAASPATQPAPVPVPSQSRDSAAPNEPR